LRQSSLKGSRRSSSLPQRSLQGVVPFPEGRDRKAPFEVEAVELVGFRLHVLLLPLQDGQLLPLRFNGRRRFPDIPAAQAGGHPRSQPADPHAVQLRPLLERHLADLRQSLRGFAETLEVAEIGCRVESVSED
jgi:hypothetical protein